MRHTFYKTLAGVILTLKMGTVPVHAHYFPPIKEFIDSNLSLRRKQPSAQIFYNRHGEQGTEIKIDKTNFIFRTFETKDQPFLKSLYQNPSVVNTATIKEKPLSEESFNNLFNYWVSQKKNGSFTAYVIEEKQTNSPVGIFELLPTKHADELEVSYIIAPSSQGKGWGSKVMQTVMEELIPLLKRNQELNSVKSLIGYVLKDNVASFKILNKMGFKKDFSNHEAAFPEKWNRYKFSLVSRLAWK